MCKRSPYRVVKRVNKISKGKRAFTVPWYVISIPNNIICMCLVIHSGCKAWQGNHQGAYNLLSDGRLYLGVYMVHCIKFIKLHNYVGYKTTQ